MEKLCYIPNMPEVCGIIYSWNERTFSFAKLKTSSWVMTKFIWIYCVLDVFMLNPIPFFLLSLIPILSFHISEL